MAADGRLKRKLKPPVPAPNKKSRTQHLTADDLPWTKIAQAHEAGLDAGLDGMMELEEVNGVEVVYEDTENGKVVKFNVVDEKPSRKKTRAPAGKANEEQEAGPSTSPVPQSAHSDPLLQPFDAKGLLPEWHAFPLHPQLYRALYAQKFTSPTPIQSKTLPVAQRGKDVIGVAETGSGKTLAYGLPILNVLLVEAASQSTPQPKERRPLRSLILAPTRELALQVSSHLNACLTPVDVDTIKIKNEEEEDGAALLSKKTKGKGKAKAESGTAPTPRPKGPPLVSVAAIVGGMSAQKQRRVLDRGVDILVATPGRLWDILQEDDELANDIKHLRFLVLDEADRMIETGHFAELDNIIRLTLKQSEEDVIEPEGDGSGDEAKLSEDKGPQKEQLQTFVFSATLSKDLQRNLKKRGRPHGKGKKSSKSASTLDDLVMRLDFRDPQPEVIDLSPEGGVVSTLKESRLECLSGDKDAYLYYFLLRYPGRSLVFLSSIDGIRRLMPLMDLLELKAFPLHSQLEQRQRLKNLDRFKSTPNAILLATDIAARGLDIPAVDHVIHYQIPRSADVYVHRNGRTARAMRSGFSLLMCAPDERRLVRALLSSLGRQEEEIPEIDAELYMLDKLKARIQVAKRIDSVQHKIKKQNHEKHWLKETAEAMELELDSDMGLSSEDEENTLPTKHQRKATNAKTAALKAELKALLAQPLIARGVSTRYITSGSRPIVDDVISGDYHETMLGLKKSQAGQDVLQAKPRRKVKQEPAFEEWTGIGED